MSDGAALIKKMVARARDIADDMGVCGDAKTIIDQVEMEFLWAVHPAKDAAQDYTDKFTEDQIGEWEHEDVTLRLRQAFMAGWDVRAAAPIDVPVQVTKPVQPITYGGYRERYGPA